LEAKQINIHADLIEACLQNDRVAQYKLYSLYSKAMLNVAYRICNDMEQAEDLLQDSFVSAFKNLRSYKGSASFGSWLKRIVINNCLNYLRSKRLAFEELTEDAKHPAEEQVDFSEQELVVEQIKEGISKLPTGYRLVISLYLLEGYDHKEIAEVLDITVSTSKSQYNRAKRKLKENLSITGYDRGYGG
jgi:RNA polymerase sigma-70 factor, ECF subfamily